MAFTKNIQAFRDLAKSDVLVDSYRLLVAVELALKDGSCAPTGGHDVPSMLLVAASFPGALAQPTISAQLNSLSFKLKNNLSAIICQGKNGAPQPVPPNSYPHIRYGRRVGDWQGTQETPTNSFDDLHVTCHNLCSFLSANGAKFGVNL